MSIIAFRYFTAETNKETSQIIKQAVTGIHEEGDEIRLGSLKRPSFDLNSSMKPVKKVFVVQI